MTVTILAYIGKSFGLQSEESVAFVENDHGEIVLPKNAQNQQDPSETAANQFKLSISTDELIALLRETPSSKNYC